MNKKYRLALGVFALQVVFAAPAHSALLTGTRLTIDQGGGDCSYSSATGYACTDLTGSYVMGLFGRGANYQHGHMHIETIGYLNDGYDDMTGLFTGDPTAGVGLLIGVAQPYQGEPVGAGAPYDPAVGQNIVTAFQTVSSGEPYPTWGTFYSTSPITDNDDGTLDFSGWNIAWDEAPAWFAPNAAYPYYPPGNAVLTLIPGGGAFGAGRYALDYYSENCQAADYYLNCVGFQLHLEGSISPVPLPAAAWLFGSGLLGLIGVMRRKTV